MKKPLLLMLGFLIVSFVGIFGQKVDATKKDSSSAYRANDRLKTAGPKDGWKQESNSTGKNQVKADSGINNEKSLRTKRYYITYKGFDFLRIEPYFDSTYYPKSLYFNIRIAEITGLSIEEINKGSFSAEIVSEKNEPVPLIKELRQYVAKTRKEGEHINILASIPLDPQDKKNKYYTVLYKWRDAANVRFIQIKCKIAD